MILTSPEPLYSRKDAAALALKPKAGALPAETREWKYGTYPLYRRDDLEPKRTVTLKPPVEVDLLAAIFTVNRTAKRYRDKAGAHYGSRQYGFATNAREVKERMYELKDRGITHAYRQGLLRATGTHGPLTYYEGGGYRFHSLLRPVHLQLPVLGEETVQVEAKPKGKREVRLKDAEFTLDQLPALNVTGFERHSFPPRERRRRWREDQEDDWDARSDYP